jgi:hypothetical protein
LDISRANRELGVLVWLSKDEEIREAAAEKLMRSSDLSETELFVLLR